MQSLSAAEKPALDHTVDHTANAAHHAVDTLADQALTGVGKVSGSLHVAVNRAADAVANGADWVARVPPRIRGTKARVGSATFADQGAAVHHLGRRSSARLLHRSPGP